MSLWSKVYPGDFTVETAMIVLLAVSLIAVAALVAAGCLRQRPASAHCVLLWALVWILLTPLAATGARSVGLSLVSLPGPAGGILSSLQARLERAESAPASTITRSVANPDLAKSDLLAVTQPSVATTGSIAKSADSVATRGDIAASEGPRLENVPGVSAAFGGLRAAMAALMVGWLCGAIVLLGRTLQSIVRMRAIRRALVPLDDGAFGDVLDDVRRRLHGARLARIACSNQVDTPCVIGLLRPLIVLPTAGIHEVAGSQLCDVLVHECAHVLRRDCVVVLLQRLAAALFWPSPVIHLFNRCLTRVREEVCDNYVLAGGDAVSYGETLLRFAELARGKRPMAASVGILHWRGPLEKRIAALIDERRDTKTRAGRASMTRGLVAFGSLCLLACGTVISSESKPQPRQPTAPPQAEYQGLEGKRARHVFPPPDLGPVASADPLTATKSETAGVELVKDQPHTLFVPEKVRIDLGIRRDNQDQLAVAKKPTRIPPLVLSGSTAFDPSSIVRLRAFPSSRSGDKVIEIGKVADGGMVFKDGNGLAYLREIRPGDRVAKGQMLATLSSREVANTEHDLIDAAAQLTLDEQILKGMQAKPETVPEVFRLNGLRNVQADKNAINRATSNLRAWGIAQKEIDDMLKEAEKIPKRGGKHDPAKDAQLGRLEIRSPIEGTVLERNVTVNEVITDNTINLFQVVNLDRLLVFANLPFDDLFDLRDLGPKREWTVQTSRGPGASGTITEIGSVVDPNQHTVLVRGDVDSRQGLLRSGQFVTVAVQLPLPRNVVEVPSSCVVKDGPLEVVFVQKDPAKANYTMQLVEVVQRVGQTAFVRSDVSLERTPLSMPEEAYRGLLPMQSLLPGTRLLQTGVVELKAILEDRETRARGESK